MIPYYNIVSLYDRLFVCLFVWVVVAYVYVCLMFCLFALHTEVLPHGLAALRYMFTCCMVYGMFKFVLGCRCLCSIVYVCVIALRLLLCCLVVLAALR